MNTENNTQDKQDDGILSFEDAITSQDSEKQPEAKSDEQVTNASEGEAAPNEQPSQTAPLESNEEAQSDDDEDVVTFESFGFCPEIMQALKVSGHMNDDHGGIVQYFEGLAGIEVKSDEQR